jgi:hypothetical protein
MFCECTDICDEPEEFLCGTYAAILDSNGNSAIKGVISYEGFGLANNTAFSKFWKLTLQSCSRLSADTVLTPQ